MRARSGKTVLRKRARTRKLTKGFRLARHNLYRQSLVTLIRGRKYAFRDRRVRKRQYRRLWIIRINAACRMRGTRYSAFIAGLINAQIILDRKSLSEIAIHDPETFTKLVEIAKANAPKGLV
jgi:large subunit ribosomal protein L20